MTAAPLTIVSSARTMPIRGRCRTVASVGEAGDQHGPDEHPVDEQAPDVDKPCASNSPVTRCSRGSVFRKDDGHREQDRDPDRREEEEQAAPVGDRGELPADDRADDGRRPPSTVRRP